MRTQLDTAIDRYYYRVPPRAVEPYATHMPVLICLARLRPVRRVLELGSGLHSTLLFLDRAAFPDLEHIRSLETIADWAARVRTAAGEDRRLELSVLPDTMASTLDSLPIDDYDLILVDDSSTVEDRSATLKALARRRPNNVVVVVHDYENPAYRRAARGFLHRHRITSINPNVGVLSNAPTDSAALARLNQVVTSARGKFTTSSRSDWCAVMDGNFGATSRRRHG